MNKDEGRRMKDEGIRRSLTAFLSVCLGFLFSHTAAFAAADLVKFPDGPAAWTVKVGPLPSSGAASSPTVSANRTDIVKIEVVQDDEKRRSVVTWSNGKSRETWSIPRLNLTLAEDPSGTAFFSQDHSIPLGPSDFAWLKPGFLQKATPVDYAGRKCFHYRGAVDIMLGTDGAPGPGQNPESDGILRSVKREAWIDSATLLPVALDDGVVLGVFTFQQAPGPLTFPPGLKRLLDNKKKVMGWP
ncbi:MAG: hypothetical protein WC003_07385 [Terrimicrobiaceae bacterium]